MSYAWLVPIGVVLGAAGTLVGAGGGFLLVPLLILLYPDERPETLTSISLAVVLANASSGSLAYARMGRIDYGSGWLFLTTALPGAALGALATAALPRRAFDAIFGAALLAVAGAMLRFDRPPQPRASAPPGRFWVRRELVERDGSRHAYAYDGALGLALSALAGFVSSLLGIGGGVIHVPALVYVLRFPPHVATATSHFILVFVALAATLVHVATGGFAHGIHRTLLLGAGALLGAPLGARLSTRLDAAWITRGLAVGLAAVAVRILVESLGP